MLYLRMCFDREDAGNLRAENLTSHREYIASFLAGRDGVKVVQGGPMCRDDTGDQNVGSFLVLEAGSQAEAQRFHVGDPFTAAGLFYRFEILRWDRHIGNAGHEAYVP